MALNLAKAPLLRPVAVLAGWTFVMEAWMYATRLPAISKHNVNTDNPTQCKKDLNEKVPAAVRYIADNFNHLHEQPQVFYAVMLSLAMLGDDHPYTLYAAWGYTGLRITHSLFQSIVNIVMVRFQLFATSSLVVAGLTGRLVKLLF